MTNERGARDSSVGTAERRAETGGCQEQDWAGQQDKRLVISHPGQCCGGSPCCFRACLCVATLPADDRSPHHTEGDAWAEEVAASVARLDHHLREDDQAGAITIAIAPGYEVRGVAALLFADDFHLDDAGMYQVIRPRTRRILDALAIPYTTIAQTS